MTAVSIAWWHLARLGVLWLLAGVVVVLVAGWVMRRWPAVDEIEMQPEVRCRRRFEEIHRG